MNMQRLQSEQRAWAEKNFPNSTCSDSFEGIVEEVGELSHARLKMRQGIRGTKVEHEAAEQDAIGDIVIYIADYCNRRGISLDTCVETAWDTVKKRDWRKNKGNGIDPDPKRGCASCKFYKKSCVGTPEMAGCLRRSPW